MHDPVTPDLAACDAAAERLRKYYYGHGGYDGPKGSAHDARQNDTLNVIHRYHALRAETARLAAELERSNRNGAGWRRVASKYCGIAHDRKKELAAANLYRDDAMVIMTHNRDACDKALADMRAELAERTRERDAARALAERLNAAIGVIVPAALRVLLDLLPADAAVDRGCVTKTLERIRVAQEKWEAARTVAAGESQ